MNDLLRKLTVPGTVLLVIDMQDKLLPAMQESEQCLANARKMVQAAQLLTIPVIVTEQYPAGLGPTNATIREVLGDAQAIEKMRFSACVEATTVRLRELDRRQVIVVGIETHVCVQQTVLDLLRMDYNPYVCVDAVSSRRVLDRDTALDRMRQAGAIITTTESAIFELLGEAGTSQFKQVLKIVK